MSVRPISIKSARAVIAGWLALFFLFGTAVSFADVPGLVFLKEEGVVQATGLPGNPEPSAEMLKVYVHPSNDASSVSKLPAVVGSYTSEPGTLRFRPRFGFVPGLRYQARLTIGSAAAQAIEFGIAKEAREPATSVTAVHPSGDAIPENHLRFYFHFSAPMNRGFASEHIRLLDANGEEVDKPFLELDEELWDPEGMRLTLFLDPGRVKRGLKPHDENGPVLATGKSYTLVVDEAFQDANSLPLKQRFTKSFHATAVDYIRPDPAKWKLDAPDVGTLKPLKITFDAPLDHAMLLRMIAVLDPDGNRVEGTVRVEANELSWSYTPLADWSAGDHTVRIDRLLEDSCGNSIERHFEIARAERKVGPPQERFHDLRLKIGNTEVARNWGEWRGPQRSGISAERNLPVSWGPGERLVWRAETAGPGASTPIVWDDRVFITAQTGRDAKIQRPGIVLSRTDEELELCIQCFDRRDGTLLWQRRHRPNGTLQPTHTLHNQCTPSCVTDGQRVIALFATGQLFCYDMEGNAQWERNLASDYGAFDLLWAHSSSPTLAGDLLYLLCDHNPQAHLLALEAATGVEAWKADRGKGLRSYSTPLVYDSGTQPPQIVVNSNPGIDSYDALTGRQLWSCKEFCKVPVPMPVAIEGMLYASRGYSSGPFMALKIPLQESPTIGVQETSIESAQWRMPSRAPYVSSPIVYRGRIYLASENGQVFCLNQATGEIEWSRKLGETFWASPVAGDGKIYLLDDAGEMVVLSDGPELTVLSRNKVSAGEGERMLGSPSISHGCLFFRSESSLFSVGTQ